MARYKTEITFADRDGRQYPAKILHYNLDGQVPVPFGHDKPLTKPADYWKGHNGQPVYAGLKTWVHDKKKNKEVEVEIKEFLVDAFVKVGRNPESKDERDFDYIPRLSVVANVGSDKHGEVWNSIDRLTFSAFIASGGRVAPKPRLELLPAEAAAPAPK